MNSQRFYSRTSNLTENKISTKHRSNKIILNRDRSFCRAWFRFSCCSASSKDFLDCFSFRWKMIFIVGFWLTSFPTKLSRTDRPSFQVILNRVKTKIKELFRSSRSRLTRFFTTTQFKSSNENIVESINRKIQLLDIPFEKNISCSTNTELICSLTRLPPRQTRKSRSKIIFFALRRSRNSDLSTSWEN